VNNNMPPPKDYLTTVGNYDPWSKVQSERKGLEVPSANDDPFRIRRVTREELHTKMFDVRHWLADEHNADADPEKHWYKELKRNSVVALTFSYSKRAAYPAAAGEDAPNELDVEFVFGRPALNFVAYPYLPPLHTDIKIEDLSEPIRVALRSNGGKPGAGELDGGTAYCHFHISSEQAKIHRVVHDLTLSPARFMGLVQTVNAENTLVEVESGQKMVPVGDAKRTLYTKDFDRSVNHIEFAAPRDGERAKVILNLGANVRGKTAVSRLPKELLPPGLVPDSLPDASGTQDVTRDELARLLAADLDSLLDEGTTGDDETDLPSCLLFSGPYTIDSQGCVLINGEVFWVADWQNPEPPEEGECKREQQSEANTGKLKVSKRRRR